MSSNGRTLLEEARAIETGTCPPNGKTSRPAAAVSSSPGKSFLRENAGPAALFAAGLVWMAINHERARERSLPQRMQDRAHQLEAAAADVRIQAAERMADLRSSASDRLEQARTRGSERFEQARERAHETFELARSRGAETINMARERASETLDSSPLLLGLGAFAAGLGLALLVPATRPEMRHLATPGRAILESARQVAQQARSVANKSLASASEAALETLEESF
ncbi:MAG: hypothetical protein AB7S38_38725 [Vulcanimicrobiota bacterium]